MNLETVPSPFIWLLGAGLVVLVGWLIKRSGLGE